jgi:hypothetical protein
VLYVITVVELVCLGGQTVRVVLAGSDDSKIRHVLEFVHDFDGTHFSFLNIVQRTNVGLFCFVLPFHSSLQI